MKNHLVIIFLVLLLGLTSCGMQKTVMSQEVQADARAEMADSTVLSSAIEKIVRAKVDEILDKSIANNLWVERKVWSPPDTAGNQYIVSEERVRSETRVTETRESTITDVEQVTEKTDSTSVSASIEDLVVDTKTDITEKNGLPWWQKTLMVIGAAFLIFLVIRIVLKFI
ncbi:MAG: hypothetical protein IJ307_05890 [Bacteroidales bacterium]|nr:hypothetical protein [Bacteroidales bacterium]